MYPLHSFEAVRYRKLANTHLDSLSRVNLISGRAASGKSSLLEAIWLFLNRTTLITGLKAPFIQRNAYPGDNPLANLSPKSDIVLAGTQNGITRTLTCAVARHRTGTSTLAIKTTPKTPPDTDTDRFHIAAVYAATATVAACLLRIKAQGDKNAALNSIKPLVPDLDNLYAEANNRDAPPRLVVKTTSGDLVPIDVLGQTAVCITTAILGLYASRDAVLILDDFCDQADPYYFLPLWNTLEKQTKQLNVQLIATTHSDACIHAAADAFEYNPEDFSLTQLVADHNGVTAIDQTRLISTLQTKRNRP